MYRDILTDQPDIKPDIAKMSDDAGLELVVRALRKARIFVRNTKKWAPTHNLPWDDVERYFMTGNELECINEALLELGCHERDSTAGVPYGVTLKELRG